MNNNLLKLLASQYWFATSAQLELALWLYRDKIYIRVLPIEPDLLCELLRLTPAILASANCIDRLSFKPLSESLLHGNWLPWLQTEADYKHCFFCSIAQIILQCVPGFSYESSKKLKHLLIQQMAMLIAEHGISPIGERLTNKQLKAIYKELKQNVAQNMH